MLTVVAVGKAEVEDERPGENDSKRRGASNVGNLRVVWL